MTIITRFPPSPTGYLHLGGARTALFAYAYARHHNGKFVLRIEDTDRERSTDAAVQAIIDGMQWLGLEHDIGPIYQTERFDRYLEQVKKLLDDGKAYRCNCSKERLDEIREVQMKAGEKGRYDGKCRDLNLPEAENQVVRFKTPKDGSVSWKDGVRGKVEVQNAELDDLIMVRSDGTPTYNFCVVVDDMDMEISHVIRGEDHINNTPRQIHIYLALGATLPEFAHVPMILGPDGTKMSKRHGALGVMEYRNQGFLPEAMLNYLIRLGWSCGDEEIFSKAEIIEKFSFEHISKSPATFNMDKLLWINQHYIKTVSLDYLAESMQWHLENAQLDISNGPALKDVLAAMVDRVKTLVEMTDSIQYFYQDVKTYDEKALTKVLKGIPEKALTTLKAGLETCDWTVESIHGVISGAAEKLEVGMGKVGMPLRLALTGSLQSPSIDVTTHLIGREKAVLRIDNFLAVIVS